MEVIIIMMIMMVLALILMVMLTLSKPFMVMKMMLMGLYKVRVMVIIYTLQVHGSWYDPSNPIIKARGNMRADLYQVPYHLFCCLPTLSSLIFTLNCINSILMISCFYETIIS